MQLGISIGIPSTLGKVAAFSPLDLSPVLWLDASDTSTITESGGAVSQWDDKSGNGNDVVQATAANQPTSGSRTLNGLNVIEFDGTSVYLRTTASTIKAQPNTIFLVWQLDVTNALQFVFDSRDTANRTVFNPQGDGTYNMRAGTNLRGGTLDTDEHVCRLVFNSVSSSLHVDGASVLTGDTSIGSWDLATIGASNVGDFSLDGIIAEMIVVNGLLTADQITATESYLASKWGITL